MKPPAPYGWLMLVLVLAACTSTRAEVAERRSDLAPIAPPSVAPTSSAPSFDPCDPRAIAPEKEVTRTLRVGGADRSYTLFLPERTARAAAPVVLAFHGLGDSARRFASWSGLAQAATARGFIAAFPEGDRTITSCWNAGDCCLPCSASSTDDVAFAMAVIDDVAKATCVDASRVFVTGFSNGAMLAHRLACAAGPRIAAVAAVSGTLFEDECQKPVLPLPAVLVVHGTLDETVPYEGGAPHLGGVPLPFDWPGFSQTVERWAGLLGCGEKASARSWDDVECLTRGGGENDLEACTIAGGRHRWVRAPSRLSNRFDTNRHVLDFFEAHARRTSHQ